MRNSLHLDDTGLWLPVRVTPGVTPTVPTKRINGILHARVDDAGDASVPEEYLTETELAVALQPYLTSLPPEAVTATELADALASYLQSVPAEYIDATELASALQPYLTAVPPENITEAELATALADYLQEVPAEFITSDELTTALTPYLTAVPAQYVDTTELAAALTDYVTSVALASTLSDYATDTEVANQIAAILDSAPATLNTLNELAAALGDDPNFAATIAAQIAAKAPGSHVGAGGTNEHPLAVSGTPGFSARDFTEALLTKLNGIEASATADMTGAEIVGLWSGTPDGTKYLRDDGQLAVPAGGSGYSPSWTQQNGAGAIFAAFADGDPIKADHFNGQSTTVALPTPTGLTVTVARAVRFRLPKTLAVSAVRAFGNAASAANQCRFAIYRNSDGVRMWDSGTFATAATTWTNITTAPLPTLQANTDYWFAFKYEATGTQIPFRTFNPPIGSPYYGAAAAPLGNRNDLGIAAVVQFAVAAGVFPTPMPAKAQLANVTNGSVPLVFLEGTAS